jgi:signal transduction histidine kinase/DNA-binding response OmpR family regulator
MNPARILLVEDQTIAASDLKDRLTGLGYDVPAAIACGEDVAAKTAEIRPDLILMEIVLNSQIEAAEAAGPLLQNSWPPVIWVTSHSDDRAARRALSAGPYSYVHRPFGDRELELAIEMALYKRRTDIEKAELLDAENRRVNELGRANALAMALSRLTANIQAASDFDQVIGTLAAELQTLKVNCVVALLDEETGDLVVRYSSLSPAVLPVAEKLTGLKLREYRLPRERLAMYDDLFQKQSPVFEAAPWAQALALLPGLARPLAEQVLKMVGLSPDVRTISVPLISAGAPLGALMLWSPTLQETDVPAFSVFGSQIAIAMERARLLRSERGQRRLAESLRDTAIEISSTPDLEWALDKLLINIESADYYDAANVLLFNLSNEVVQLAGYRGVGERRRAPSRAARPVPAAQIPTLSRLAAMRQPQLVTNASLFPDWVGLMESDWVQSFVSAPILRQGKTVGCLNLLSARPGYFNSGSLEGLRAFADLAAFALERAAVTEVEARRRTNALALQRVMEAAVAAHLDMQAMLNAVVVTLAQVAGYPLIRIFLAQHEEALLAAHYGYRPQHLTQAIPPDQRLITRVLETGQPVFVPDIQEEPDYESAALGVYSLIVFPLTAGGGPAGALVVETRADRELKRHDFDWLADVSRSVSASLENARLYTDLQALLNERERTQIQLIQTEKMLALGRLAASFAHEINNPLQAMQGSLTLVREELGGELRRDKLYRYLGVAEDEIVRVAAIVNRMRDFYRPQPVERKPIAVAAVLASVLELTAKQLQEAGITVEREGPPQLPEITANPDELKQVFLNLVLNALDATPRGGRLRILTALAHQPASGAMRLTTTTLKLRPLGVRLEFADTGHGMPPETLARVFEPFFTSKEQGSGLGLYVSYNIIHGHGGYMTATSAVGEGTTFAIWLPVNPPAAEGKGQ